MITKIFTMTNIGLQSQLIGCEIGLTPSLPMFIIVGLPDKAVQESRERVKTAIKQSGYDFPIGKVIINLTPADIIKSGSSLDLPMAVGILSLTHFVKNPPSNKTLFLGELSLDGKLRAVTGVLTICLWAQKNGYESVFIPKENEAEARLVKGIDIFACDSLNQVVMHLNNEVRMTPIEAVDLDTLLPTLEGDINGLLPTDMAYVKGQMMAKRALEIAASGGHNVMFIGQPGSGKTLLARSYPTILPRMTEAEILEATQIYSIAGLIKGGDIKISRPFRAPHHSCSHIALVGGGAKLRPGEISLAHRGVLFLDEFPEFSRESIECLRQPLEDGHVTISRASGSVQYPSRFYLLAAANPTPSGFDPEDPDGGNKPQNRAAIARYQGKFSGPILDRIDLQVEVNRPSKDELQSQELAEASKNILKRVQAARNIQTKRFVDDKIYTNAEMNLKQIQKYCKLSPDTQNLLNQAVDKFKLSARSYMRILKLSRTIADLENKEDIEIKHLAESLQFRGRWGN